MRFFSGDSILKDPGWLKDPGCLYQSVLATLGRPTLTACTWLNKAGFYIPEQTGLFLGGRVMVWSTLVSSAL